MWSSGYSAWPLLIWLSDSNSPTFKTVVHGIIGGVPVPFPTANGDVNPPVPIQQNQKITYTNAIFVEPAYPKVMQTQRLVVPNFTISGFLDMFFLRTKKKISTGVCNFIIYFKWMRNRQKILPMSFASEATFLWFFYWFANSLKIYIFGIFLIW